MNIEHLLQRNYWHAMAESIWIWLEREVFVRHTLINLIAVVAAFLLAGLIARALKPKLSEILEKRISKHTALSRFLSALENILTYATAIILLWVALVGFRQLGLKTYLLDDPQSICQLNDCGDNAVKLEVLFCIQNPENGIADVSSAVRMKIWEAFKANDIEIPFPQRVVHMAVQKAE